jgi:hypothetical protein
MDFSGADSFQNAIPEAGGGTDIATFALTAAYKEPVSPEIRLFC